MSQKLFLNMTPYLNCVLVKVCPYQFFSLDFYSLSLQPCFSFVHGSNNNNEPSLFPVGSKETIRYKGEKRKKERRNRERGSDNRISQTAWFLFFFSEKIKRMVCLYLCLCVGVCECVCHPLCVFVYV